jgi:hypothetical protein
VFGTGGLLFPPYIDVSHGTAVTDLNGHDMLIGYGTATVRKVLTDFDSFTPGLEPVSLWASADLSEQYGGTALYTLARISGSVFTSSGSTRIHAEPGRPVTATTVGRSGITHTSRP